MNKIKFSHRYEKMPKNIKDPTMLMAVFIEDSRSFGELFIKYDTLYYDSGVSFYPLPVGKVLVLFLITHNHVWTTIRRWTPQKEKYYRSIIGQDVEIIIENKK